FNMSSSDIGQFGINTPTYFAIDNLVYKQAGNTSGIAQNATSTFKMYPNPAKNYLQVNQPGKYTIYTLSGRRVFTKTISGKSGILSIARLSAGIYIIEQTNHQHRSI